jgi:hypothetical protein
MNGHPWAHKYPLPKLAIETEFLDTVRRRELAIRAVVDQHVGSACFSGGKKATKALEKLIRELEA